MDNGIVSFRGDIGKKHIISALLTWWDRIGADVCGLKVGALVDGRNVGCKVVGLLVTGLVVGFAVGDLLVGCKVVGLFVTGLAVGFAVGDLLGCQVCPGFVGDTVCKKIQMLATLHVFVSNRIHQ